MDPPPSRPWTAARRSAPLVFEPVPPSARLSPARREQQIGSTIETIRAVPRIDALNVPELVDENHEGRPYYRTEDPRTFGRRLKEATHREVIVNKVVAHLPEGEGLERWARETVREGIHHVVLVGGSSRYIPYPGPAVLEANRRCEPIFAAAGGEIGNIAIPQREGEAHRMVAKARCGARFFTTQILFAAESVLKLIEEYDALSRAAEVPAAPVLLSVAPLADEGDAEFVRWLGADIPEAAEREILGGAESEACERSVAVALELWSKVLAQARALHWSVPLGVNVEQISTRHLGNAAELLHAFAKVLPPA